MAHKRGYPAVIYVVPVQTGDKHSPQTVETLPIARSRQDTISQTGKFLTEIRGFLSIAAGKVMDEEPLAGGDKSLKTVNAIRQVPIHPRLIELGLLEYVDALKAAGYDRLFPELKHNKIKGYSAAASKWFNENYFGKILGFPRDGKKTFHSLRHTFINAVDEFEINERTIAQLVGHVRGSTTAMTTYRKDADVGEQFGVISQLHYSLPDIAQFDSQAGIKAVIDARRRHKS
ncbi:hypothetical protein [Serratia marcescens]|uniref:hypothetical protein n=1 Tax=Serratia marcescens TaxID=615 RepID=UPI0015949E66|nr:hypothetical protein [Serratia marcescens]